MSISRMSPENKKILTLVIQPQHYLVVLLITFLEIAPKATFNYKTQ